MAHDSKGLINAIDADALMKKGLTDATVRFVCHVNSGGWCSGMATYGGTPGSDSLAQELRRHSESGHPGFVPAVYHGQTCPAEISGTAVFVVKDNKPHLRIYLTEESDHLAHGDDFISPQPIYVKGQKFRGFRWPQSAGGSSGLVILRISVDVTGKVTGAKVAAEKPEGRGFGAEVMGRVSDVVFIPAYQHGKPVASTVTIPILFKSGMGGHWKAG